MLWNGIARLLTALVCIVVWNSGAAAQAVRPLSDLPGFADMPARWGGVMDLFDVPGMAVAVVRDGQIYSQGFGIRDPASGAPATPATLFYIASITKTFTATGICVLADQGRLKLDDPVRKYLPRFQLSDSVLTRTLTIRDLLCHRQGIDSQPIVLLDAFTGEISEDRFYHWLEQADIKGSVEYTNLHFTILGRVIEAVSGKPWRDFLREAVLAPAGMKRTTGYASALYKDKDHAVPSERLGTGWHALAQVKTDATMHAAGGMGTSAIEAARWLQLHLQDGTLDGKRVLAPETARTMRTLQAPLQEPDGTIRIIQGFGFAWSVGAFNGHPLASHSGGYAGAAAYMALLPDDHAAVVVMMNASGLAQGLGDVVAVEAMERLTGTTSPWIVYDRYTARAKQMKEKRAQAPPDSAAKRSVFSLSHEPKRYAGAFKNPWWGVLHVQDKAGSLSMTLGGLALDVEPGPGAAETFVVDELLDADTPAHFVLDPAGHVDAIQLQHPKYGEVVFRR